MNNLTVENRAEDTIYALAASPNFLNEPFCFSAQRSGLQASADGGLTWRSAFDSLAAVASLSATALGISPNFALDRTLFVGVPGGILASTDGGETWITSALPTPPPFITALVLSPDYPNDGIVLAGSIEDGVFLSEDSGASWNAWNFGLLDQKILCLAMSPDFSRDHCVYAGTESGLYCSKNRGRSWHAMNFPSEFAPILGLTLSPKYALDGTLWIGSETHGLFCSSDYGQSWKQAALEGAVNHILLSPHFPDKGDMLVLTDIGLHLSRDAGQGWLLLNVPQDGIGTITSIAAPNGLEPGSVLLLGFLEGSISHFTLL